MRCGRLVARYADMRRDRIEDLMDVRNDYQQDHHRPSVRSVQAP